MVAHAKLRPVLAGEKPALIAHLNHRILGGPLGLTFKEVGDRGHSVKLELLIGVEL